MPELLAEKTPQTAWWMLRSEDGQPVQWPLLLAAAPMLAVLSVPAFGAMLLLLPAMVPVLALAPLVVLASLPWWLNLPMNGKPLVIPLVLAAIPFVGFFSLAALSLLPMMLLGLSAIPAYLSLKWTWPIPDFTALLQKFRNAK